MPVRAKIEAKAFWVAVVAVDWDLPSLIAEANDLSVATTYSMIEKEVAKKKRM